MPDVTRVRLLTQFVVLPMVIVAALTTPSAAAPPPPTSLRDITSFLSYSIQSSSDRYADPVNTLSYQADGKGIEWQVSTDGLVGRATVTYAPWGLDYKCGVCTENITPFFFERSGKGWYLIQSAEGVGGLGGQGLPQQVLGLPSLLYVSGRIAHDVVHGTYRPGTTLYSPTRPPLPTKVQTACAASLQKWLTWARATSFASQYQQANSPLVTRVTRTLSAYLYPPSTNSLPAWLALNSTSSSTSVAATNYCTYVMLGHALRSGPSPFKIPAPPAK